MTLEACDGGSKHQPYERLQLDNGASYSNVQNSININKKHSWCCGTPEPRIFIARCQNWRKRIIIIYRCSRSIKYFHLPPLSVIASGGRNQSAKFGCRALNTFRSTSGPNLVNLALMVSKRRCRHDGDGVRVLSHKRLRQLRWARALKMHKFWSIVQLIAKMSLKMMNVKLGTTAPSALRLWTWRTFKNSTVDSVV